MLKEKYAPIIRGIPALIFALLVVYLLTSDINLPGPF
jgi:ABC-type arginine transport system permease subunit